MVEVQCVDGSVLSILPVPKSDRGGLAFEVTLRLLLDGEPFGDVRECSRWRLARTADALRQARAQDGPEAFPVTGPDVLLQESDGGAPGGPRGPDGSGAPGGPDGAALRRLLPRERELLSLRARDPDDGGGAGELRLWLRSDRTWVRGPDGQRGRWSTRSLAVLDGWGDAGRGVRCSLDSTALLALLDALVAEADRVVGRQVVGEQAVGGPVVGEQGVGHPAG